MNEFVTVKTFSYPHELAVIRAHLESEGIECYVKDELTIQVNPFYSNAVGGVKLQVKQSDFPKAIKILNEAGYSKDEEPKPSKLYLQLEKLTSNVPLIKKLPLGFRLLVIGAVLISSILSIAYVANLPTTFETLTENTWCIDHITYNGKNYQPNSLGIKIIGAGFCEENIDFGVNGIIDLPGFNTYGISGSWKLEDKTLEIFRTDTFDFVYNGIYEINFLKGELILQSTKTTIHCFSTHFNYFF